MCTKRSRSEGDMTGPRTAGQLLLRAFSVSLRLHPRHEFPPPPLFHGVDHWLLPFWASSVTRISCKLRRSLTMLWAARGKSHVCDKCPMPHWNNVLVLKGHRGRADTVSKQKLQGGDSWASVADFAPSSPSATRLSHRSSFFIRLWEILATLNS